MRNDILHDIKDVVVLTSTEIATNTDTTTSIVDLQGVGAYKFMIKFDAYTDGVVAYKIEEGEASNLSDAVEITGADRILSPATQTTPALDVINVYGAIPLKRYVRLTITTTGITTGLTASVVCQTRNKVLPVNN